MNIHIEPPLWEKLCTGCPKKKYTTLKDYFGINITNEMNYFLTYSLHRRNKCTMSDFMDSEAEESGEDLDETKDRDDAGEDENDDEEEVTKGRYLKICQFFIP